MDGIVRSATGDKPREATANRGRWIVWISRRGNHLGQQPRCTNRPDTCTQANATPEKSPPDLASKGPSTHDPNYAPDLYRELLHPVEGNLRRDEVSACDCSRANERTPNEAPHFRSSGRRRRSRRRRPAVVFRERRSTRAERRRNCRRCRRYTSIPKSAAAPAESLVQADGPARRYETFKRRSRVCP